jgi:AcrR family transcriptional regulator
MTAEQPLRKRDAAATKEALLDAAAQAFGDKGYDRTTVRDIARLAGANQALLFRYFGSKEELFKEVLTRAGRELLATTPPEQVLETALRSMLTPDPSEVSSHALLAFVRSIGNDSAAAASRRELGEQYLRRLTGLSDQDDAELRADLALAWLVGIGLLRTVAGPSPLTRADPDQVCALVLNASRTLLERTEPIPPDQPDPLSQPIPPNQPDSLNQPSPPNPPNQRRPCESSKINVMNSFGKPSFTASNPANTSSR